MAEVSIKSLGEPIPTDNWQVKDFEAAWRDRPFLIRVSGEVMGKATERSYASSRIASNIWSMTEKAILEEAASRRLSLDGFPIGGRLTLSPEDIV